MQKYRLKKDLPRAEAGTIVKTENTPVASTVKLIFNIGDTEHPLCTIDEKEMIEGLEEIPETPKSVWDLKEGDKYYFFSSFVIIERGKFSEDEMDYDRINFLNAFITREEAEKELEKRKAIAKIKKYCWKNGIDTEYSNYNNIVFTLVNGFICYNSSDKNGNPLGYFNALNAQKILENFEEELKIILE